MDEHKATLARLQTQGLSFFANLENKASKREKEHFDEARKEFFNELYTVLKNEQGSQIVIAGPGFEKEAFKKYLEQKNFDVSKTWFEHCSNAEESGVHELLKKGVLERALADQKIAQDYAVLEEFKAHLGKDDGLIAYGIENVAKAVEAGSVERIVVLDELLRGKTSLVSEFIDQARKAGAKLVVFDKETAPGQQFEAFKIAAFLRYRVSW
jgi:protein pelota